MQFTTKKATLSLAFCKMKKEKVRLFLSQKVRLE